MKIFCYPNIPTQYHLEAFGVNSWIENHFISLEKRFHQCLLNSQYCTDSAAEADFFYVPFYAVSLGHQYKWPAAEPDWTKNYISKEEETAADKKVQRAFQHTIDLIRKDFPFWDRYRGGKHLFLFSQARGPNTSQLFSQNYKLLRNAIFLCPEAHTDSHIDNPARRSFSLSKDIVVPGYQPELETVLKSLPVSPEKRWLASFRGAVWRGNWVKLRARQKTQEICNGQSDVSFSETKLSKREYWQELRESKFALCPAGITPWALRFYESILAGTPPVIISDRLVLPFRRRLNYDDFTIRCWEKDLPSLLERLRNFPTKEYDRLISNLKTHQHNFTYSSTPATEDAFENIIADLYRRYFTFLGKVEGLGWKLVGK